ncbi:hypothetical protein ADK82_04090 [Streptomyces sp. NRRL S-4]|nr:hypothetical protein ADK82_04090 [Streptomyces sp. NRRL S-4]
MAGGGQAGLAAGHHLRRQNLDFVILDAQPAPGGAWQHTWDALRLFSPAAYSSLPGWLMPAQDGTEYPDADHVVRYPCRAGTHRRPSLSARRARRLKAAGCSRGSGNPSS